MKKCNTCNQTKPFEEFHKRSGSRNGYQTCCKICRKARDAKRFSDPEARKRQYAINKNSMNKNRQRLYDYAKDKSCIICGESDNACLQFDHRDGTNKLFNVSEGVNKYGWIKIFAEISKCDILCANCHHKRTAKQKGWYKDLT
jgi:hypothetical protein